MKTLYKSIPESKTSHRHKWSKNVWYKIDGELDICNRGFHASKNIIDAMGYVDCGYIAKVQVRGKSIIQDDKECWEEMKIINWYKWNKKDSISLSIFAAELVLKNFEKEYPDDKRPREAIEAAKKVLRCDNQKNRDAESAAESAGWSAESAACVARSAARSAAWSAAESAAESAGWSAESAACAAWSAAWSAACVARSAARSAACVARSAARSAAESAESAARARARSAESAACAGWSAESADYNKTLKKSHNFVIQRKFK